MRQGTALRCACRPFWGQKFLDVLPGPANAANIGSGSLIPSNKTTSPVDFDQFLQQFDKPTRDGVSTIVKELGATTDQRGADINGLLGELQPLSVNSTPDLQTFAGRKDNLNSILVNLASVGDNLAVNRDHLAGVQTHLNTVLGTIATNDTAFRRFITQGNIALNHGLNQFDGEQQNINDFIRLLRPALDRLTPTLVDVNDKAHQFDNFMKISEVFTGDLFSSVSQYNHNPNNQSCGAPGCGGFYLRQPSVLANTPANTESTYNNGGQIPSGGSSPPPSSAAPGLPPLIPGLLNIPGGLPALPALPNLPLTVPAPAVPGLLNNGPNSTTQPSQTQQDLLNWLLH